jgi:hypothetical protein
MPLPIAKQFLATAAKIGITARLYPGPYTGRHMGLATTSAVILSSRADCNAIEDAWPRFYPVPRGWMFRFQFDPIGDETVVY